MAELVVKSRCKSALRDISDVALNVTFPVWGIVSPALMLGSILGAISAVHSNTLSKAGESLAFFALWMFYSVTCLLLKRMISLDYMIIDKQGIRLPHMLGNSVNLLRFTPWKHIDRVAAIIPSEHSERAQLSIRKKGRPLNIGIKSLEPEFVEQFIISARMWAPEKCDENLDQLQNAVRLGAREAEALSYTDLWEDELGRRFCPTAYIPLEPGRGLRNSTVKVVSHLASGGLSALYLCQLDGKQLVVLKEAVIPQDSTESVRDKAKEMFDREAKLLMKLDNPGIVKVLDCFSEGERNYLLMEYINGVDLRQLVRQNGVQKEADVLEWALQVANTLKHLHEREQPIIHRDLTPDNIVLRNDGKVIIVDFGAANEFIGNATGTFVGKHSYIAPEQLRGKANVQSDIYAFGCTLFFMLTGADPEALNPSNPNDYFKEQAALAASDQGACGGEDSALAPRIEAKAENNGKHESEPPNGAAGASLAVLDKGTQVTATAAAIELTKPIISEELCELIQSCTQLEASDRYQSVAQLIPVLRRLSAQSIVV